MNNITSYDDFVNEGLLDNKFSKFIIKLNEKIHLIFNQKQIRELKDRAANMTDVEKEQLLDKIKHRVSKWKASRGLLTIAWFFALINYYHPNMDTIPPGFAILTICWFISDFLVTKNNILREKVKEIFEIINN